MLPILPFEGLTVRIALLNQVRYFWSLHCEENYCSHKKYTNDDSGKGGAGVNITITNSSNGNENKVESTVKCKLSSPTQWYSKVGGVVLIESQHDSSWYEHQCEDLNKYGEQFPLVVYGISIRNGFNIISVDPLDWLIGYLTLNILYSLKNLRNLTNLQILMNARFALFFSKRNSMQMGNIVSKSIMLRNPKRNFFLLELKKKLFI